MSPAPAPDPDWLTQREAAELLGVVRNTVYKMVDAGDLTPRVGKRPSISRAEVLELASARRAAAEERERRREAARRRPPDEDHDWLLMADAAEVLGCSLVAMQSRSKRGAVPSVLHAGRRWFRSDLLEQLAQDERSA